MLAGRRAGWLGYGGVWRTRLGPGLRAGAESWGCSAEPKNPKFNSERALGLRAGVWGLASGIGEFGVWHLASAVWRLAAGGLGLPQEREAAHTGLATARQHGNQKLFLGVGWQDSPGGKPERNQGHFKGVQDP